MGLKMLCASPAVPQPLWVPEDHVVERDIGRKEKGKFEFCFY